MLNNPLGTNALLSEVLRYAPEYAIRNMLDTILEKVELAEGIEKLGFGSPGDVEEALNGAHERIQELEDELTDLRHGKGD